MIERPDFIVIGAMKCATSTLHEQLARQPGIFMSTPKEPNFFSDDEVWARGIDWYCQLFASAPAGALCGESSTHYSKWPTHPCTVTRLSDHLSEQTRFIYIMRDPIDRLISQYIHEWTQRKISCSVDEAIDRHPELVAYSRYSIQLKPYLETFGPERVFPMFFERLAHHSQSELERVCEFIGYERVPSWDDALSEQNASSQRLRQCGWRDAIVNFPGLRGVRRVLIPNSARNWVKSFWTMKQRPTISEENRRRLRDIFDEDLVQLGSWIGMDLKCDNFKELAANSVPSWRMNEKANAA